MKGYKSQTRSVLFQYQFISQIWRQCFERRQRKVRKTKCKQQQISGVQIGQTQLKLNLIWIMWGQISSQYHKRRERKARKTIFAKGNNSINSKSNMTKFELHLYYVKTNSYTKFEVNITKDRKEKFGKQNFWKGQ